MTDISFIFGQLRDTEKVGKINALSVKECLSIAEGDIKKMLTRLDGEVCWRQNDECVNHWNACVEGFSIGHVSGSVLVDIYVQGDSTDEDFVIPYTRFTNPKGFFVKSPLHSFNARFDPDETASAIRHLLKEFVRRSWTDKAKIDRQKLVQQLQDNHQVKNSVTNEYYRRYHMSCDLSRYSSKTDVAAYLAYFEAQEKLRAYIDEHAEELIGKTDEELKTIYSQVFNGHAREFRQNFTDTDFKEWRSRQFFF